MFRLASIVTTAPRPKTTLRESLVSFRHAGFHDELLVLADGVPQERVDDLGAHIVVNDPPLGCLKNWAFALTLLVERASHFDYVAVLQDDILWALNSNTILEGYPPPGNGVTSLYCPRKVSTHLMKKYGDPLPAGYVASELGWETWGAQAFLFTPDTARQLRDSDMFVDYVANYVKNRNVDRIVGQCLMDIGIPLYYRVPCLVNHELGNRNSSLGRKPLHLHMQTDYFVDVDPPSMAIH